MGRDAVGAGLTLVLVAAISARAGAQSGCASVLLTLTPCLGYTSGSSPSPSVACCSQLAGVVQSQPKCLCLVAGGSLPFGIRINQARVLALPRACNVTTPPSSDCNVKFPSAPAPTTPVLAPSPTMVSAPPPIPRANSGNGSKEAPSPSGGSIAKLKAGFFFFLIWIGCITL